MKNLKILLHNHTMDGSIKDAGSSCADMVKRAKELGYDAMAISEHGNMYSADIFVEECKKYQIIPVIGVEGYFQDENCLTREHIILYGKTPTGVRELKKAVTAANANGGNFNKEILRKYFGKGAAGYGQVICTSACEAGVLSSILLRNNLVDNKIHKLISKNSDLSDSTDRVDPSSSFVLPEFDSSSYDETVLTLEDYERRITECRTELNNAKKIAKKSTKAKEKAVEKAKSDESKKAAEKILETAVAERNEATKMVPVLEDELESLNSEKKSLAEKIKELKKEKDKFDLQQSKYQTLLDWKKPDDELIRITEFEALSFQEIFAPNDFFIELQYHGRETEAHAYKILAEMAHKLSIPTCASNDAHIDTKKSLERRRLVRELRFNSYEDISESDKELFIKTEEELKEALIKILPEENAEKAIKNNAYIAAACYTSADAAEEHPQHYPKFPTVNGENAEDMIRRLCFEKISERFPEGWTDEYQKRLDYELQIICSMGYADYHLIVQDFLQEGRRLGLDENGIGCSIGPGRGSAAGSLVCYLLGITDIDPIKYGLMFERFLNPQRASMPDIDSDISPEVRDNLIKYVDTKYKHTDKPDGYPICGILTKGTLKAKGAIKRAAATLGIDEENGKADAMKEPHKKYLKLCDVITKMITDPNAKISDVSEDILKAFAGSDMRATVVEILSRASLLEGAFINTSVHAAGIIISDNGDIAEYMPLEYNNKKNIWLCESDMVHAEAGGMLKMDFLGLNTLYVIADTLRMVYKNTGVKVDINNIPIETNVIQKIYGNGDTDGIFQFESDGMKDKLKQLQPSSIDDVILMNAAYRPGPMDFIDDIILIKSGQKNPSYPVAEMAEILDVTYGYPIYQEQLMKIFQKFAGYDLGKADLVRKHMAKKHVDEFMKFKPDLVNGLVAHGATQKAAEDYWESLVNFAKYAFNKSHAAAYSIVSYRTAWLKYHYPAEFMCALINHITNDQNNQKVAKYIKDCREMGIIIHTPDVNYPEIGMSCVGANEIRFGIGVVKGVASAAEKVIEERKNGPYSSLYNLMIRTGLNSKAVESLIKCGACDSFMDSRKAMTGQLTYTKELIKKLKEEQKKLEKAKTQETVDKIRQNITDRGAAYKKLVFSAKDDTLERLNDEKAVMGICISQERLNLYEIPQEVPDVMPENGETCIAAMLSDVKQMTVKKTGEKMGRCTAETKQGDIDCVMFAKTYKSFGEMLENDAAVMLNGTIKTTYEVVGGNDSADDDEDSDELSTANVRKKVTFFINSVTPLERKRERVVICMSPEEFKAFTENELYRYKCSKNGYLLSYYNPVTGTQTDTKYIVSQEIMSHYQCSVL